ncbi:MAG TPA: hypothetical protein DCE55_13980 [Planctomycetaceae bacterium]|nr:hypothetical protein [Planctomycetaceae bacterium]
MAGANGAPWDPQFDRFLRGLRCLTKAAAARTACCHAAGGLSSSPASYALPDRHGRWARRRARCVDDRRADVVPDALVD